MVLVFIRVVIFITQKHVSTRQAARQVWIPNRRNSPIVDGILALFLTGGAKDRVAHSAQVPFVLPVPRICKLNNASKDLLFRDVRHDTLGSRALIRLTCLQYLDLSTNSLNAEAGAAIAGVLPDLTGLQHLNLHNNHLHLQRNGLGGEGVAAIAGALPGLTGLQYLNLSYICLGAQGGAAVAGALPNLTGLQHLQLENTNLGAEGGAAVAGALFSLTRLQFLCIAGNDFGDDDEKALRAAADASGLSLRGEIDLEDCDE
jgi:hypothetical protein